MTCHPRSMVRDFTKIPPSRFFDQFEVGDGCWEWDGYCQNQGYGLIRHETDHTVFAYYAHRYSFEFFNGSIPAGHNICHRCDNKKCVNPAHLFAGLQIENCHDAMKKGRLAGRPTGTKGALHPHSKLKDCDIRAIRARYDAGESPTLIAADYHCTAPNICYIGKRKSWRHIT